MKSVLCLVGGKLKKLVDRVAILLWKINEGTGILPAIVVKMISKTIWQSCL